MITSSQPDPSTPDPSSSTDHTRNNNKSKNKRKSNILWYNPTFSLSLTTPFGRLFLQLLDKHFPVNHPLHPIMNRKRCKISYSCPPSMLSIINAHNKRIIQKKKPINNPLPCNCRKCPVPEGDCRSKSVIYSAEIRNAIYYGLTSLEFKDRIISHRQSFREKNKQNATALSSFIWNNELNKDNETISEPKLNWKVVKKCNTYRPGDRHCDLCLSEKVIIIKNINNPKTINKKTDVGTTCVHRRSSYLSGLT